MLGGGRRKACVFVVGLYIRLNPPQLRDRTHTDSNPTLRQFTMKVAQRSSSGSAYLSTVLLLFRVFTCLGEKRCKLTCQGGFLARFYSSVIWGFLLGDLAIQWGP